MTEREVRHMPNDYLKKEPSKTEKMIYELYMQQQQMERGLWTTSAHICALAILLGADPEKVGELMANGEEKIKEYSQKVNETIQKIEKEKHAKEHKHEEGEAHTHAEAPAESPVAEAAPEEKAE